MRSSIGSGVEPTDVSFREAITFATEGGFDAFVAVGGGSTIDTAKAANLYASHPADFLDYVNAPIGKGKPVPGPLKPLIAVPTTAGTGSETTGVAIFDYTPLHAKTGIAHRRLRPLLGILDPENTRSMPPQVAAARLRRAEPRHRVVHRAALPPAAAPGAARPSSGLPGVESDQRRLVLGALRWVARYFVRAVEDPDGRRGAREDAAGGRLRRGRLRERGVHLPHGMSYPVSGMVRDFHPAGFPGDHPLVPHGMSVILNAPAVFRFTAQACPDRHLIAAEILGADVSRAKPEDAGKILSDQLVTVMQRLKMPNGLSSVGYGKSDIPALVQGTLPQARVTKLSPRPVSEADLTQLFEDALRGW